MRPAIVMLPLAALPLANDLTAQDWAIIIGAVALAVNAVISNNARIAADRAARASARAATASEGNSRKLVAQDAAAIEAGIRSARSELKINSKLDQVHTLVNGGMGEKLLKIAELTEWKARQTKTEEDGAAAMEAQEEYDLHTRRNLNAAAVRAAQLAGASGTDTHAAITAGIETAPAPRPA